MSHTTGIAHGHKTRIGTEERIDRAVAHVLPGGGTRSFRVLGELVTLKISSRQTGGAYALFEATTPPGVGPPPHIHHREDESFYVLEGEYEFLSDGETLCMGPGSLIYVPKGTLHTHRNVGEGVGRVLLTQTPGGLYEIFFEKLGTPTYDEDAGLPVSEKRPEAGRRIAEVAAEHGIEIRPLFAEKTRPRTTSEGGQR